MRQIGSAIAVQDTGFASDEPLAKKDERISLLQHNPVHSPSWVKGKDCVIVFTALAGMLLLQKLC